MFHTEYRIEWAHVRNLFPFFFRCSFLIHSFTRSFNFFWCFQRRYLHIWRIRAYFVYVRVRAFSDYFINIGKNITLENDPSIKSNDLLLAHSLAQTKAFSQKKNKQFQFEYQRKKRTFFDFYFFLFFGCFFMNTLI